MNIIKFIKDIIAPKKCYSCKKEGHFLCPNCLKKRYLHREICYICKRESIDFLLHRQCKKGNLLQSLEKIILLAHYKDSYIARLIKDAKYYHKKDILEDMGKYLAEQFAKYEEIKEKESYIITAPPMYFLKKWKRSYNHSEILGKHIANILGIEADFKLLKKVKYTKQQSRLSQKDREKNILSSFAFNEKAREKIIGKTIIIVDDVISTGATIAEMAHILQKNGAKKIIALIIASD